MLWSNVLNGRLPKASPFHSSDSNSSWVFKDNEISLTKHNVSYQWSVGLRQLRKLPVYRRLCAGIRHNACRFSSSKGYKRLQLSAKGKRRRKRTYV